jgi:hypothetical protein
VARHAGISGISIHPTDPAPGWKAGRTRVLPSRYTIKIDRWAHRSPKPPFDVKLLTDDEHDALVRGEYPRRNVTPTTWVELEIESSPEQPPRCIALRAPLGIGTPELRFPLASIVDTASATIASADGTFIDWAKDIEFEDTLFEIERVRRRRRRREKITDERLTEIAQLARKHPRKPTAAVVRRFGYSRGYTRRLIKMAEERGL